MVQLRLGACLAMCLIFQENRGWRAYKRVAYKKVYMKLSKSRVEDTKKNHGAHVFRQ